MTIATSLTTAAITGAMAAAVVGAPTASATDEPTVERLGDQISLVDGSVVQGWTVGALARSADTIPFPVQGTLWEATATDEALQGNVVVPIVSNFNARTPNGLSYRALFQVPTALGVNPSPLAQGQKTSGKIYFDVTGDAPDSVVYNAGERDLLVWTKPAPNGAGMAPGRAANGTAAPSTGRPTEPLPVGDSPTTPSAALMPAGVHPPVAPPPGWVGTPLLPGTAGTSADLKNTPPASDSPDAAATIPSPGWQGTPLPADGVLRPTEPAPAVAP